MDNEIEARFRILEDEIEALQLVISWLLSQIPGDEAVKFLALQANELDGNPKFQTLIDVLDELRGSVASPRDGIASDPGIQR